MTFRLSYSHLSRVSDLVPIWLEQELVYANRKHGDKNPQSSVFAGGLGKQGLALLDLGQYVGRFANSYNNASGNEYLLLSASQALGKHVGTARALVSAVLQQTGFTRPEADELTISRLESRSYASVLRQTHFPDLPFDPRTYWEDNGEPLIQNIATLIGEHAPSADILEAAEALLDLDAGLFVGYTALKGVVARPGLTSGDVEHWLV
jgi:hypothetical protein